ncbi:hypothetical protein LEP1GSC124_0249 [Leptospira interrogans serovar Pyrogenes str. 200701872]|uniref:Uncharacterized protein n=1 Tax=Leptospira interrogans serovar Pyrogenes str. 200701872 TaxID=1193029 RepID=M7A189_LEPIR|nr:hypothetical protein LEP1GSC124_0249 [Leptospira interrogans serovar Pyrogenes str. 200701872]
MRENSAERSLWIAFYIKLKIFLYKVFCIQVISQSREPGSLQFLILDHVNLLKNISKILNLKKSNSLF